MRTYQAYFLDSKLTWGPSGEVYAENDDAITERLRGKGLRGYEVWEGNRLVVRNMQITPSEPAGDEGSGIAPQP